MITVETTFLSIYSELHLDSAQNWQSALRRRDPAVSRTHWYSHSPRIWIWNVKCLQYLLCIYWISTEYLLNIYWISTLLTWSPRWRPRRCRRPCRCRWRGCRCRPGRTGSRCWRTRTTAQCTRPPGTRGYLQSGAFSLQMYIRRYLAVELMYVSTSQTRTSPEADMCALYQV